MYLTRMCVHVHTDTHLNPSCCRSAFQHVAYISCLKDYRHKHQFIGFIDSDEVPR